MSPIPADHQTTVSNIGLAKTTKLIANAAWNYRRTMSWYLRKGDIKGLNNFLYTKTLVPTGEGSGELAYYFIGGLLQKYPQLVWYPRNIEIEITSKCNKHCVICEHTWWNEKATDLTFDEFKNLTNQFDLKWVNLTGEGDAFLNKDYLRMIELLKRRGTSVFLVDSFDLIDREVSQRLVKLGVDGIYISMDGATKETYESIKVGCNYDKVIQNIKQLLAWKKVYDSPVPEICFRFVVTKKNMHEMAEYVTVLQNLGSRKDFGDGSKIHFVGVLDFPEIHDLYVDEVPQIFANGDIPVVFAHTGKDTNPNINRCLAWMEPYFALVPQPMALPCCAVMMSNSREKLLEYSFGNYNNESMKSIWNSSYYRTFRRTVTNQHSSVPALCQGCRAFDTREREKLYGIDYRKRSDF